LLHSRASAFGWCPNASVHIQGVPTGAMGELSPRLYLLLAVDRGTLDCNKLKNSWADS